MHKKTSHTGSQEISPFSAGDNKAAAKECDRAGIKRCYGKVYKFK